MLKSVGLFEYAEKKGRRFIFIETPPLFMGYGLCP